MHQKWGLSAGDKAYNVFVHKLRAFCLLEADFNQWNKLIFAKQMMQQAIQEGSIPPKNVTPRNIAIATMWYTEKVQLLTYKNEYIFDGVEYTLLIYKVIMRLATIDSAATTQMLQDNLQNLSVFAETISGNIDKISTEFNKNYSQILA